MPSLGSGTAGSIDKRGVYIPAGSVSVIRAALANAATARVDVVCPGDSTMEGPSDTYPLPQKLRAMLLAAGYADGGPGSSTRGAAATATDSGPDNLSTIQSITGFALTSTYGPINGKCLQSNTRAEQVTFQGKTNCARIHFARFNSGGRFSYKVNGGAKVNVDPVIPVGSNIWQPEFIEITGLVKGSVNTVQIINEGGMRLQPLVNAATGSAVTGSSPGAGTYYYKVSVYNYDKSAESAASAASAGITVTGSQSASLTVNGTSSTYNGWQQTTGNGRQFAVYRATSAAGPFQYLADMTPSGTGTTFVDDGTATPNAGRTAPSATADSTDGSAWSNVKATVDFYNTTGVCFYNYGVAGSAVNVYFDTTDSLYNQGGQGLYGLFPLSASNVDQQGKGAAGLLAPYPQPKLVMMNWGVNDIAYAADSTASVAKYANDLSLAVRMARNAGSDVLILVPQFFDSGSAANSRAYHGAFRNAAFAVARSHGVAALDLAEAMGSPTTWGTLYGLTPGQAHPNDAGYTAQATFIYNQFFAKLNQIGS